MTTREDPGRLNHRGASLKSKGSIPQTPEALTPPCVAGVLVGGRSKRMKRHKALLRLPNGCTLVEHVVEVASEVTRDVVILGETIQLPASLAGLRILPDAKPNAGPLAGLCSLLAYAHDRWSLLVACDMPCIEPPVLRRLLGEVTPQVDAVAFAREDQTGVYHACCALYHPRIQDGAMRELAEGEGRLQAVLSRAKVAALSPNAAERRQLANVNTPEDFARLLEQSVVKGKTAVRKRRS
ncbi:MAG: molybdenum cofactor guanylyltransferase [Phycisphaerae bacterium]|nr:molybdenum cofactor guanylyltransferase [Phycisphaerae bacterium]